MNIDTSYYSDIGGREMNEDSVAILESNQTVLGVVADGLGGHPCGEVASKIALSTLSAHIAQNPVSASVLHEAIRAANDTILNSSDNRGMKTTIAALWFDNETALAATVGDTRVYQIRNKKIIYQSTDHTVAQMSVFAGDITKDEIRSSRDRHVLTRALGAQDEVKPDIVSLNVVPGDTFLLCSDGFWEIVQEKEMLYYLMESDSADTWLQKMRGCVKRRETMSSDNHSAVAIRIKRGE